MQNVSNEPGLATQFLRFACEFFLKIFALVKMRSYFGNVLFDTVNIYKQTFGNAALVKTKLFSAFVI